MEAKSTETIVTSQLTKYREIKTELDKVIEILNVDDNVSNCNLYFSIKRSTISKETSK